MLLEILYIIPLKCAGFTLFKNIQNIASENETFFF